MTTAHDFETSGAGANATDDCVDHLRRPSEMVAMTFPGATPIANMTLEEQLAYWQHFARIHESRHKTAKKELAELRTRLATLARRNSNEGIHP